jgi:hypothetical protein
MPTLEEHVAVCERLMGEGFIEVHKWLDEFHGKKPYGTRHRYLRHTQAGIEEVRKMWGERAAQAAEIHIKQDLSTEGWPQHSSIPRTSEEFKKSGLW